MNLIFLDHSFSNALVFDELKAIRGIDNLMVIQYHENLSFKLDTENGQVASDSACFYIEKMHTLCAMSPGPYTLKLICQLVEFFKANSKSIPIVLTLPEYYLIKQLEVVNFLMFEAFCTYLSTILSTGYEFLTIVCSSNASASYYSSKALGGFMPRVVDTQTIYTEYGVVQNLPMGLG